MKKLVILIAMSMSFAAHASLDSLEFIDCFERAANEVISDIRASNSHSTKRICENLPEKDLEIIHFKLSYMKDRKIQYYSAEDVGALRVQEMYDYLKNHVNCYSAVTKGGGLIDAMINSPTYHRNLKLTKLIMQKITNGAKSSERISEVDLSYCK